MCSSDLFMTDKRGRGEHVRAAPQYDAQRWWFGIACSHMPLFMALGNHDGEKGESGTAADDIGPWSYRMRTERFPAPQPGAMYSGRTDMKDGRAANYYAFEWGDAQVVVLDPYWATTERLGGGGGGSKGGGGKGGGGGPGGQGGGRGA